MYPINDFVRRSLRDPRRISTTLQAENLPRRQRRRETIQIGLRVFIEESITESQMLLENAPQQTTDGAERKG